MLSLIFAATVAQAAQPTVLCNIKEGGKQTKTTSVQHVIAGNAHGALTTFETAYATGFVSDSKGYTVINFVLKDSKQVISFYGDALAGRAVGGNFYTDGSYENSISVECVLQK